ncbi:hypothetical protein VPNG_00079 [Cytospora leucostoma]|uniref:DJ-1/PfpI domain-containing protein n=1 Tax=Cytospora leucostoma TaxID=1230097 RepID=A0A423XNG3_9PEZI|nr:hypothetical protein VPNG_00079 [Cytospora leucostoma]
MLRSPPRGYGGKNAAALVDLSRIVPAPLGLDTIRAEDGGESVSEMSEMARKHLHIGVYIPSPSGAQLLDTACVDILAMMSHQYLSDLAGLPERLTSLAPDVTISYIGAGGTTTTARDDKQEEDPAAAPAADTKSTNTPESNTDLDPVHLTAGMRVQLTHHTSSPAVAPGKLDAVLVPGPDPRDAWTEDSLSWLRAQAAAGGTHILSVCTGIFICGAAGLLGGGEEEEEENNNNNNNNSNSNDNDGGNGDGNGVDGERKTKRKRKVACGPRGSQPELRRLYPGCDFVGDQVRWVRDGNLWSSGGVTNGNDMVAAYCRAESGRFPGPVVEVVLGMADVKGSNRRMPYRKGYGL